MGRERLTLGDWATRIDAGFGTWSGIVVQHIPTIPRKELLKIGGIGAVVLLSNALRLRLLENAATSRELTPDQLSEAIKKAAKYRQEWGMCPDFEKVGVNPWEKPDEAKEVIGREDFVVFFAHLDDCDDSEKMKQHRSIIETIIRRGSRPVISLGIGSTDALVGHPFDPKNGTKMVSWMRTWAQFVNSFACEMDIRFLYEMNLPPGKYVAYCDDGRLSHEEHVARFLYLFDMMYTLLGENSRIRLAFCPSSAGEHTMEYVPTRGVKAVGVNIFDFSEGKNGIGPFNLIRGLAYMEWEVQTATSDVAKASAVAGNVPMYIYEIGSLTHEVGWLEKTIANFFALGGRGIAYFNYNKSDAGRSTETNWTLQQETLAMIATIFHRIDAVRKKNIALFKHLRT